MFGTPANDERRAGRPPERGKIIMDRRRPSAGAKRELALCVILCALAAQPLRAQSPEDQRDHTGAYAQADIEYGARLYAERCVACHGERGDQIPGVNFRSGALPNSPTDRDLSNILRDGIPGTAMSPTGYNDTERTALVAYIRNMGKVDLASVPQGDPARGREIFEGKGECASCHRVDGRGSRSAPDLSDIGALRTAATLQLTLVDPDAALQPINRPVHIVTRDGRVIDGRRLNEDTFTVQLIDEHAHLVSLEKSDLREYDVLTKARMPSYAETLNDQERADVLAYLLSLKGAH
jgi:putative heme-binding domain-containing protein